MAIRSPLLILPDFVLPNALPGTAQWISDIPADSLGHYEFSVYRANLHPRRDGDRP
jgi:hypothetical protein